MKAAAYARYSTNNQTENSIEYQLAKIRDYCKENGIEIAATYKDEAQSGTNTDRPGFQAMLAAASRKEFDAVVVYDISRSSRDVGDWFTFRKSMQRLGIAVLSATQKLGDIANGNEFLLELLSVGLGQREVLETRQKSIDGVAVKAKQGLFLGGTPPLGYDIENSRYVVNPMEAEIVQTIFAIWVRGMRRGLYRAYVHQYERLFQPLLLLREPLSDSFLLWPERQRGRVGSVRGTGPEGVFPVAGL